mmetsp:Transcript_53069/g.169987  ORF Transcript_53069/g.169987 Transcript_53069/m.169987 type:complete len:232 (+) Transcript_53069:250-945(+)
MWHLQVSARCPHGHGAARCRLGRGNFLQACHLLQIPQACHTILRPTHCAVGREVCTYRLHHTAMPLEASQVSHGPHVPDVDIAILRAADGHHGLVVHRQSAYRPLCRLHGPATLHHCQVPKEHHSVVRPAGCNSVRKVARRCTHGAGVSPQRAKAHHCIEVPEAECTVHGASESTARGRVSCDDAHRALVPAKAGDARHGIEVPHAHRAVLRASDCQRRWRNNHEVDLGTA